MKTKLFLLGILAAGSMFAQTRFSVTIGNRYPGYSDRYKAYGGDEYERPYRGGYGYPGRDRDWRYDRERAHEHAEKHALRSHQQEERWEYGDSEEVREHQIREHRGLQHEQWHERHGDPDAGYGPGHRSAYDGDGYRN